MKRWIFFTGILMAFTANAQDEEGKVTVHAEAAVEEFLQTRQLQFAADSSVNGYRIQIFISTDRKQAMAEEEKFRNTFPGIPLYMKYDAPNFKLRVGDYNNKLEAQYLYKLLSTDYPRLFLVPDRVYPLNFSSVLFEK